MQVLYYKITFQARLNLKNVTGFYIKFYGSGWAQYKLEITVAKISDCV